MLAMPVTLIVSMPFAVASSSTPAVRQCDDPADAAIPTKGSALLQSAGVHPHRPRRKVHLPRESDDDHNSDGGNPSTADDDGSVQDKSDSETVLLEQSRHMVSESAPMAPMGVFFMAPMFMSMATSGALLGLVYWFARDGQEDDKLRFSADVLSPVSFKPAGEGGAAAQKGNFQAAQPAATWTVEGAAADAQSAAGKEAAAAKDLLEDLQAKSAPRTDPAMAAEQVKKASGSSADAVKAAELLKEMQAKQASEANTAGASGQPAAAASEVEKAAQLLKEMQAKNRALREQAKA